MDGNVITTRNASEGRADLGTTTIAGAWLEASEWSARAAALEYSLTEYFGSDPDEHDLDSLLAEAGELYGLNEHDAESGLQLMQFPMRAPSFRAAAMVLLTDVAVVDGNVGIVDGLLDVPNIVWIREGCWCWGSPSSNPRCPHHFPRD